MFTILLALKTFTLYMFTILLALKMSNITVLHIYWPLSRLEAIEPFVKRADPLFAADEGGGWSRFVTAAYRLPSGALWWSTLATCWGVCVLLPGVRAHRILFLLKSTAEMGTKDKMFWLHFSMSCSVSQLYYKQMYSPMAKTAFRLKCSAYTYFRSRK